MPIIGIDVGGTNTDAALLRGGVVEAVVKVPTSHRDLFASTKAALDEVLGHCRGNTPLRLHLSTTLSTNTIVQGQGAPTQVLAIPGPGVNLASLGFPFPVHELSGYVDHRGRIIDQLQKAELVELRSMLQNRPELALAVVGKFSQRNPILEQELGRELAGWHRGIITLGHRLSGRANFPRRLVTAFLNASVAREQHQFAAMWTKLQEQHPLLEEIVVLKADGGTMSLAKAAERPVETILSGPAASVMGARALCRSFGGNMLIADIGGTTTDLAVVVEGQVLFARDGAEISRFKTLVPALLTRSLGLGGDSAIKWSSNGTLLIGPERAGTPVCLGGEALTPTDAAVALGLTKLGDIERAIRAWRDWAAELELSWDTLAGRVMTAFTEQLAGAVNELYSELETQPLYTVSEILNPPQVQPERVVGLGAPAPVFIPLLAQKLQLPQEILPFCPGANAIGAAAARPTVGLTLHADTELGRVAVSELGWQEQLARPLFFDLAKARELAQAKTLEYALEQGYVQTGQVDVLEEESFRVVRGFHTVGQIHHIRTQLRPEVRTIEGGATRA